MYKQKKENVLNSSPNLLNLVLNLDLQINSILTQLSNAIGIITLKGV